MKKRLKGLRALNGLSQKELAKRVGTSQPVISLIEGGHVEPRENLKKAIAKTLETAPEILFPPERAES